jgi:alginate O-acetyltransferase complex protein AlgI
MAVGLGYLFGLRLPQNFNSPFKAVDIADFWRRWHISLSTFLRDYLYIPLGGSRGARARTYRNLMITMLLGGLWHGAGWTFLVWGAYQGTLLSLHRLWGRWWDPLPVAVRRAATFLLVAIGFVVFRSESLAMAGTVLGLMFSWHAGSVIVGADALLFMLVVAGGIAHFAPNTFEIDYLWRPRRVAGALAVMVLCLFVLYGSRPTPFLYFQF